MSCRVALQSCRTYAQAEVDAALEQAVDHLGGWTAFAASGQTVLLKPNLIAPVPPERAATTHPAILDSLCRRLLDLGAKPVIGDAPAWSGPAQAREVTGVGEVCERYGIEFWFFDRHTRLESKHRTVASRFHVDPRVLEVDRVINVGKLKAHQQLGFTCCLKNLYGCLAGREKAVHHFARSRTDHHFALYLAAFGDSVPVTLNLADAVVAMEGPGPRLGMPRPMGFVAASESALALDTVMAEVIGAPATHRLMLDAALELGLDGATMDGIEVVGDPVAQFAVGDFVHPALLGVAFSPWRVVKGWYRNRQLIKAGRRTGGSRTG